MENGQKYKIPLDSDLDVKSSDMLVPVSEPKFLHNRQKFQGRYLPTSVRFEHDGWAAGNDVYQFDITEAFVEAGSFIVSKQNINKNPTYKLIVKDQNNKQVGYAYYNMNSKIKSYNMDSASVSHSSGPNPVLTGSINGKVFQLNYDSITGTFEDKTPAVNKLTISTSLKSDYTFNVIVKDDEATINISFDGMKLPTEVLQNVAEGSVDVIGTFSAYSSDGNTGTSIWSSGRYTFSLNDNGTFTIQSDDLDNPIVRTLSVDSSTGLVSGSFDVPLKFTDSPQVMLKEFYPFFSNITASSLSKTVQSQASDTLDFNRWQFTLEDREHNSSSNPYNQDKLFRNIIEGHTDYNKQTIEHIIPIWFGITARKGFVFSTSGLSVVTGAGVEYKRKDVTTANRHNDYIGNNATRTAHIILKANNSKKRYSASIVKPLVNVWEGTVDKAADYLSTSAVPMYTINVTYKHYTWYAAGSTGDKHVTKEVEDTIQFHLNSDWTGFSANEDVSDLFSTDDDDVTIVSATATINDTVNFLFDFSSSDFYNGSNFSVNAASAAITPPFSLKGMIGGLSNINAGYNNNHVTTLFNNSTCFWGRCCMGKIASNIYIKSTEELTSAIDASVFAIEQSSISEASSYIDLSDIYYHKIVQVACHDNLSISVYICSKKSAQVMFYAASVPQSTALSTTLYMPGHIIHGDKKQISDSENSNLSYFTVNRSYSATTVDINYGMSLTVSGVPVKTSDNNNFNYISAIYSATDLTKLILGNRFTNEVASELASAISWSTNKWTGWVDINTVSFDDIDFFKDCSQSIELTVGDNKINLTYLLQGKLPTADKNTFIWRVNDSLSYIISLVFSYGSLSENTQPIMVMNITYSTNAQYVLSFYKPQVFDKNFTLMSLEQNVALLTQNATGNRLKVDFDTKQVVLQVYDNESQKLGPEQQCDETWGDNNTFILYSEYIRSITAVLAGVYNLKNIEVISLTASQMDISIDGEVATVNTSYLFSLTQQSKMSFLYTRVNEKELSDVKFAEVISDNEMQFLKQQWDTTNETENFWWLNDTYILALTKSKLIIRKKTDELTDWDGNKFEDVLLIDRTDYITSSVLKYFCSSAYDGQSARFITVQEDNGLIKLVIYNFISDSGDLLDKPIYNVVLLSIVKHSVSITGETLCTDNIHLHTYSDLVISNLISQAKWSATCIDDNLIIGCHYDNNFNQWAIIYSINNNSFTVIQGYGFVGVNGCLTGGEIPTKYFNKAKGFIGAVKSLDALSDASKDISALSELSAIDDLIVGTDAQQWYISKNIQSIVSHLTYANGTFTVQELKLNNNYSVNYDSASYCSTVFSDYSFNVKPLKDLLPESNGAWNAMLVLWTYPMLYFLDPKISVANYLQQTLGQAAYVHYNSTSVCQQKDLTKESVVNNYSKEESETAYDRLKEESVITSDEISFDRQSVKQTQSTSDPYTTMFTMCAAALVSALDWGQEKLQVNKNQNQSAISDFGRKYSSNFIQNLNSMAIADMSLQSINPTQTSEVTAIKTLDMFYSTSDKQQIQAGPGYVNHNFVAQCIAQSVTSVQSEYSQQKLLYIISALTMLPIQQLNKGLTAARDAVKVQMESIAGPGIAFGGFVVGATFTTPASIALGVAYAALNIACNVTQIGLELLPQMLEALGDNKLNSSIVARQSKHAYDIEGKHRYGSKSECFMWPCFGVESAQSIIDESVEVTVQNKSWKLSIPNKSPRYKIDNSQPSFVTKKPDDSVIKSFNGNVPYFIAMVKGKQSLITLPEKMAFVIGSESFLATSDFKNENIGESEPVFPTAPFQDYIIDESWQVGQTASVGMTTWVSVKDTKVIDGELSNAVISEEFCGIASAYTAIEVKRGIQQQYVRPWAITPQALALNQTGFNCCFEEKAYHAFDGYGYRIVNWLGSAGMNKEHQTWLYSFLANDRFKRSNKMPQNEFIGNFKCDPVVAQSGDYNDKVFTLVTQPGENNGLTAGTIGEDKDVRRYALPVFSEFVNTLPATVKTVSAQVLSVIDGITSLTTDNRDIQTAYKAPISVDFTIGRNKYRFTQEYICSLQQTSGVTVVEQLVPCLGLEFIGSTPYEAYLYSQATRQYYMFTGGSSLQLVDLIERFRDVVCGRYDFVNQEVIMFCLATFLYLDKKVLDDSDDTDNVLIPRLKDNKFIGEVWPPLTNIYNTRSWFKTLSLPCGVTYQGPNRCIINRFTLQDFMVDQVKSNYGLWKRVPREEYHPFRNYKAKYEEVDSYIGNKLIVKGWTHNPFLLVTAPLGINSEVDCKFEWEITFCWPVEMNKLYEQNNYATVNIQAETMTPGGKVIADRPTHVYLTKELFTRTGNYGYYSFRYQSNCGAGNRERLHIWSDQFICISDIQVEVTQITTKRTEQLTQQLDIQLLKEI